MDKRGILELKKRINAEECSFTKIAACYVNFDKNTITKMNQRFLTLEEEEYHKYLDILKKVLDKRIKEKFLTLEINSGDTQNSLIALVNSGLNSEEILESFYDAVKEKLDIEGNYLIVLVHDAYDVPKCSKAGENQDESEEVYEYVIGAICPVQMSKAGLGYNYENNTIKSRVRDWVVAVPECGFIYPAFEDRSADIEKIGFYTKNSKQPHHEVITGILGCKDQYTSVEYKCEFERSILRACRSEELTEEYLRKINYELSILMEEQGEDEVEISVDDMGQILENAKVPKEYIAQIMENYRAFPEKCYPSWLFTGKQLTLYMMNEKKEKVRDLLSRASTELLKNGPSETADDIEKYLENTR